MSTHLNSPPQVPGGVGDGEQIKMVMIIISKRKLCEDSDLPNNHRISLS